MEYPEEFRIIQFKYNVYKINNNHFEEGPGSIFNGKVCFVNISEYPITEDDDYIYIFFLCFNEEDKLPIHISKYTYEKWEQYLDFKRNNPLANVSRENFETCLGDIVGKKAKLSITMPLRICINKVILMKESIDEETMIKLCK